MAAGRSVGRLSMPWEGGRGDWIRTSDLLNPIQVRYQAALRPDGSVLGRNPQYTMAASLPDQAADRDAVAISRVNVGTYYVVR
jgi:hypothetical protein